MQSVGWFITGPFIYIAVLVFLLVTIYKVIGYATMPRHLRWDLYPVPHQGPGGSKYQKVDYNKLPPRVSLLHEIKEMSQEMLFIKKAFVHNPKLWKGTFPLHAGIYLCGLWLTCLILGAGFEMTEIVSFESADSVFGSAVQYLTLSSGVFGLTAGLIGSLILLWQRCQDENLRYISDAVCYLNLVFMVFLFGTCLGAWMFADPGFIIIRQHIMTLLTFNPGIINQPLVVAEFLVLGFFLLILPFSRMMHFAVKYFFYHNIMWDDELMRPGCKMEQGIARCLNYKVDWSASHVNTQASWRAQVYRAQGKEGPKADEKKDES